MNLFLSGKELYTIMFHPSSRQKVRLTFNVTCEWDKKKYFGCSEVYGAYLKEFVFVSKPLQFTSLLNLGVFSASNLQ